MQPITKVLPHQTRPTESGRIPSAESKNNYCNMYFSIKTKTLTATNGLHLGQEKMPVDLLASVHRSSLPKELHLKKQLSLKPKKREQMALRKIKKGHFSTNSYARATN